MCGNSENVTVHLMIRTLKDQLRLLICIDPMMVVVVYPDYGLTEADPGFSLEATTLYFVKFDKNLQKICKKDPPLVFWSLQKRLSVMLKTD